MADTKNVEITRAFDAPLEQVWDAWTQSDSVKQWWGPMGFTCPVADMDVKVGGTSYVCMRAPAEYGGMEICNGWGYTTVEPPKGGKALLEYTLRFTDKDRNVLDPAAMGMPAGVPKEVPHVIAFEENDGKTTVSIVEKGYTTDEAVNVSTPGQEQCMDKMAAMLAK